MPRGTIGTVQGMAPQEVTDILAGLLATLGGDFSRAEAAMWLRGEYKMGTEMVHAMLSALARVPGVRSLPGKARYTADPTLLAGYVKHRTWRMALPHANLEDAVELCARLGDKGGSELPPNLERLHGRLKTAIEGLS